VTVFGNKPSLAGGLLLIFALAACADRSNWTAEQHGEAAYRSYQCARCHRIGYAGGDAGPDLTFAGFRKSKEFMSLWLKDPRAWQPNTKMPNFHLNDRTRENLAAYLATLQGGHYRDETAPWDRPGMKDDPIQRGFELYRRVGCITCHGREGAGGYPNNNVIGGKMPALTKVKEGYSREELINKIKIGVRHPQKADPNGPEPHLWMPGWGEVLRPDELELLADYLISLYPKELEGGEDDW
jgi:mono/diheme cytochrome c family protein